MFERLTSVATLLAAAPAFGQALTVQQPVVETFSGGTTVSVPDRGAVYVGGVGRASAARSSYGPLRSRSAYARSTSASSVSAGVLIHDFEAMDAGVLDAASGSAPRPAYTKGRYDDPTSYAMSRRWGGLRSGGKTAAAATSMGGATSPPRRLTGETPAARPVSFDGDRLLKLGAEAERRGQPGVAAIHYRAAAKDGSPEARRRSEALARPGGGAVTTASP